MTLKQKKFADEYIVSGNATEAAIKAGYSEKTARIVGSQNLTKLNISEYIKERLKKIEDKKTMTLEEALQRMTSIARREVQKGYSKRTDKLKGKVDSEFEYELTPSIEESQKALEHLIKCYGGFENKREVEARIRRIEAETEKIIEETARKSGKQGEEEANTQVLAIADLINHPMPERNLNDFMGGEDSANTDDDTSTESNPV